MPSDTTTDGIRVEVQSTYWEERSIPQRGQWAFAYHVKLTNVGTQPATLRTRHWLITDATGHVEEVRGEGVIGKQPRLLPGETFEYSSWAMLRAPFGSMHGEYTFEREGGARFDAVIGSFALTEPNALH